MSGYCVVCGGVLKTGRKYCHIHRSLQHEKHNNPSNKFDKTEGWIVIFAVLFCMFFVFWLSGILIYVITFIIGLIILIVLIRWYLNKDNLTEF